jgi:hypothetical protein
MDKSSIVAFRIGAPPREKTVEPHFAVWPM